MSPTAVYYVTAHEDDWQLFRGYQAYIDLQQSDVYGIFITVTAGDNGDSSSWWQAREAGEIASIEVCLPYGTTSTADTPPPTVKGHNIQRTTFTDPDGNKRAVLYSLRLPDGNMSGAGFPSQSDQSIEKLQSGEIQGITTVDGSTTYDSWDDLVGTIQTIMSNENPDPSQKPWVNANQCWYDTDASPKDHPDHVTVGLALNQFTEGVYRRLWWQAYQIENEAPNLSDGNIMRKKLVYNAYYEKVKGFDGQSAECTVNWNAWGNKSYSTTTDS